MKRSGRLARVSPKRRRLNAVASEWRAAFVVEIGRCEICNCRELDILCGHEIVRASLKPHVYMNRALVLVVCAPCHRRIHDTSMPVVRQLAYLYRSRPLEFRLADVNRWSIKRISRGDVLAVAKELDERDPGTPQPNWR